MRSEIAEDLFGRCVVTRLRHCWDLFPKERCDARLYPARCLYERPWRPLGWCVEMVASRYCLGVTVHSGRCPNFLQCIPERRLRRQSNLFGLQRVHTAWLPLYMSPLCERPPAILLLFVTGVEVEFALFACAFRRYLCSREPTAVSAALLVHRMAWARVFAPRRGVDCTGIIVGSHACTRSDLACEAGCESACQCSVGLDAPRGNCSSVCCISCPANARRWVIGVSSRYWWVGC